MAAGKINLQANDGKVAGIVFEDGASTNVAVTVPKAGGKLAADSTVVHKTGDETIAGVKTFSLSPIVPVPTLVNQAISMGNIIEKTGVGLGYGTGSGGTVTQLTSKSTAVTLNKPCGQIVMNNAALVAGASVTFQLVNSSISVYDTLVCNLLGISYLSSYSITCVGTGNGYAYFSLKNNTGSNISDAVQFGFSVVKGTIA